MLVERLSNVACVACSARCLFPFADRCVGCERVKSSRAVRDQSTCFDNVFASLIGEYRAGVVIF